MSSQNSPRNKEHNHPLKVEITRTSVHNNTKSYPKLIKSHESKAVKSTASIRTINR